MVKLLKHYLKKYSLLVFAVMVCTGIQVFCELALPKYMADIVDIGLTTGGIPYILKHGSIMILMSVGQVGAMLLIGFMSARISSAAGMDIRRDIFVKAQDFALTDLNRFTVSSMIVRNTNDVTVVQNFIVMLLRMVLTVPVICIGSIIVSFRINAQLARVILFAIPILAIFFSCMIFFASRLFVIYRSKLDNLNLLIREHLSGTRVIRAFVNQKTEGKKFESGNDEIYRIALKINRIMSGMRPGMMFVIYLTTSAVCYVGINPLREGTLSVGQLMSMISYVTQILMSLSMLSFLMIILPRTQVSAKRINEVLETKTDIASPEVCRKPVKSDGTIEFRNVTFAYPDSNEPVIKNASFVAEGGKTTAIIGSTGCGKSTLQRLIIRLYDVTDGAVLCDGVDVRDYDLADLRSRVGYIPQRAVLFTGSVADNIRFGYEEATSDEIKHALEISQAWDFVEKLENGIDSPVSQGGKNFSGGQKQRLAIARAIVKPCEAIVFDDSFSALDYATDAKLRKALSTDNELKKKTKIIIAQRISTVMNADKIIVLDKGEIVGEGKHRELLKTCLLYREIAYSQLSEEELGR